MCQNALKNKNECVQCKQQVNQTCSQYTTWTKICLLHWSNFQQKCLALQGIISSFKRIYHYIIFGGGIITRTRKRREPINLPLISIKLHDECIIVSLNVRGQMRMLKSPLFIIRSNPLFPSWTYWCSKSTS